MWGGGGGGGVKILYHNILTHPWNSAGNQFDFLGVRSKYYNHNIITIIEPPMTLTRQS